MSAQLYVYLTLCLCIVGLTLHYVYLTPTYMVSQKTAISVKNSMTEGKRKLEWRRVRIYIYIYIYFCSSTDPTIVKKTFQRIFGNFITQNLLWIYIIFHVLPDQKILENKILYVSAAILTDCAPLKKSAHAHNVYFGFGYCALLSVGLLKSKNSKSKIISKLPHQSFAPGHRIFDLFWIP